MEHILRLLPKQPQPLWVRYAGTLAIVAVFFLIRAGLDGRVGTYGVFLMTPAIFLPAVLFDRGSGFLATAVSAALIYSHTGGELTLQSFDRHVVPFGLFVAVSRSGKWATSWPSPTTVRAARKKRAPRSAKVSAAASSASWLSSSTARSRKTRPAAAGGSR